VSTTGPVGNGDITVVDTRGREHKPLVQPDKKVTVLFFVLPDCPISNAYAPEIKRIAAEYAKKQVAAFVVYADPDLSAEDAKKHVAEYGFEFPAIRDTSLALVKHTGVTVAPEVVVVGPNGKRLYRGRIDDLYADYGKRRAQPSRRDLRDALDAILAGKPVPRETTKAVGCFIAVP
jgi:thiol-disulfide isomerase/thioredoxin